MTTSQHDEIRNFVSFGPDDAAALMGLADMVQTRGAAITDHFYEVLGANATTAPIIAGRVDALKKTHRAWLEALVRGGCDDAWFTMQAHVGQVHVRVGVPPMHVELTFSLLRKLLVDAIHESIGDTARAAAASTAVVKAVDMALATINLAYAEERLNRLCGFTGFSRKLIENCISKAARTS